MRNARFLKVFGFTIGLLLLTACAGDDTYGGGSNSGGYGNSNSYGNSNGYGNYGGYNNGGYYPYGNANYPRDRIYIVNGYNPCNGYVYQGYCYRDKDDYRNAVIWDQNHRNDANWNKKRKDWCRTHDCSRDHDTHGRDDYGRDDVVLDAQGKPVPSQSQPPIRKRAETLRPEPSTRQHENHYEGSNRQPVKYQQPVYRAPEHRQAEQHQQPERMQQPVVRQQPVRQQPVVQQPEYRQQRSEPVQRVQPQERQQQSQEQKPQRRRSESLGSGSSE